MYSKTRGQSLHRKFILAVSLWLGCFPALPFGAAAQTVTKELGLDEAVSLALDNNLDLKKNIIDISTSGYSEKRVWSEVFPTINATASAGYGNALFSDNKLEFKDAVNYRMGVGFMINFNAGTPFSMKSIKLAHQTNLLKYEDACSQISIQITKRFYALTAEHNNLDYLEEILNLAQRQYERNQVSFRNGLIRELDLMKSRLAVENARYDLSWAGTSYANNLGEFLVMLGLAQDEKISLAGTINVVKIDANADELIRQYLPGRPDIVRNRQEIEQKEYAQRQAALQGRAPSLSLSVDWNTPSARTFNPIFTDNISGSARLSIPIDSWIPGTGRSQTIRRANDTVEKAKLDLTAAEDAAKNQIRSLAALLRNSWDSITIARLSLEVAQRSYELTEQGFRNGTIESLALEDARNNMANARQRLLQNELSYFNMTLDLSAALNIEWKNFIQAFGVPDEEK